MATEQLQDLPASDLIEIALDERASESPSWAGVWPDSEHCYMADDGVMSVRVFAEGLVSS
ncbi:MAG: hypothetical protein HY678_01575 [Chloroflexi bacterium]|nr:hypothetical protein [Chloroflexota bacterium]